MEYYSFKASIFLTIHLVHKTITEDRMIVSTPIICINRYDIPCKLPASEEINSTEANTMNNVK